MYNKYKISKFRSILNMISVFIMISVFLMFGIAILQNMHFLVISPLALLVPTAVISISIFQMMGFFKYTFKEYAFELINGEIKFIDGKVPIKLKQVSKIKLVESILFRKKYIKFEMKPEHRKFHWKFLPILGSLGFKYTWINFLYIKGGSKSLHLFYKEVCEEHKKYQYQV